MHSEAVRCQRRLYVRRVDVETAASAFDQSPAPNPTVISDEGWLCAGNSVDGNPVFTESN
eukprot:m.1601904 g.1601904  ORF g.1601904 m.1601904 type:complete len:60 (+) comp25353_c0_seq38:1475-1654(+)